MKLNVQYLPNYDLSWGELSYKHDRDAGFDLRAAVAEPIVLKTGEFRPIPTGIKVQLITTDSPLVGVNYEIQIRARSGLAAKFGVTMMNGVGTVDLGYRGEIHAILVNHGKDDFIINPGDRIAQGVIAPVMTVAFNQVDSVEEDTTRGTGGFGSTGRH
ncbi:MAG: dUTP diphosphatase [Alphaproteobacteria bacterium]